MGPSLYERIYGKRKAIGAVLLVGGLAGCAVLWWPRSAPPAPIPGATSRLAPASTAQVPGDNAEPESIQVPSAPTAAEGHMAPIVVQRYRVLPGTSLWCIARRQCGSGISWRAIYSANQDRIEDPDLIFPGQELLVRCEGGP